MTNSVVCARCGKTLKNPIYIAGKPYGKKCAENWDKPLKSTGNSGVKKSKRGKKADEHETLDAFLAQPVVEY